MQSYKISFMTAEGKLIFFCFCSGNSVADAFMSASEQFMKHSSEYANDVRTVHLKVISQL